MDSISAWLVMSVGFARGLRVSSFGELSTAMSSRNRKTRSLSRVDVGAASPRKTTRSCPAKFGDCPVIRVETQTSVCGSNARKALTRGNSQYMANVAGASTVMVRRSR